MNTSHLTAERLAALADDTPTAAEQAHLDSCVPCCRERQAHVALLGLAGSERTRIGPPSSAWESIAAQLRSEGLVQPPPLSVVAVGQSIAPPERQQRASHVTLHVPRWVLQAAAAVVLVAGGMVAGRMTARDAGRQVIAQTGDGAAQGLAQNVALTSSSFRSREEAQTAMQSAEHAYQRAAEFLAATDSASAPASESSAAEVYRARLAAFDGVVAATQQALYAAPADPVINRAYLATNAAREVALKQLNLVSPAGMQINRY